MAPVPPALSLALDELARRLEIVEGRLAVLDDPQPLAEDRPASWAVPGVPARPK